MIKTQIFDDKHYDYYPQHAFHSGVTYYSYSQNGVLDLTEPVPFENQWSFWHDKYLGPGKTVEEYAAALLQIGTFSTVQDFWCYYNNLPSVSQLQVGSSFHLMKKDILPLWEDKGNAEGGTFSFKVAKNQTAKVWLYLLLATVGEQFDCVFQDDDLCGISISVRKGNDNVISLWNRNAKRFNFSSFFERVKSLVPFGCDFREPKYSRK
jgi:hypothetical protein